MTTAEPMEISNTEEQQGPRAIQIVGLELLKAAENGDWDDILDAMREANNDDDVSFWYTNDSLDLNEPSRRRIRKVEGDDTSYVKDSVQVLRQRRQSKKAHTDSDEVPLKMVFAPDLTNTGANEKDLSSAQVRVNDVSQLKPRSLVNRAA